MKKMKSVVKSAVNSMLQLKEGRPLFSIVTDNVFRWLLVLESINTQGKHSVSVCEYTTLDQMNDGLSLFNNYPAKFVFSQYLTEGNERFYSKFEMQGCRVDSHFLSDDKMDLFLKVASKFKEKENESKYTYCFMPGPRYNSSKFFIESEGILTTDRVIFNSQLWAEYFLREFSKNFPSEECFSTFSGNFGAFSDSTELAPELLLASLVKELGRELSKKDIFSKYASIFGILMSESITSFALPKENPTGDFFKNSLWGGLTGVFTGKRSPLLVNIVKSGNTDLLRYFCNFPGVASSLSNKFRTKTLLHRSSKYNDLRMVVCLILFIGKGNLKEMGSELERVGNILSFLEGKKKISEDMLSSFQKSLTGWIDKLNDSEVEALKYLRKIQHDINRIFYPDKVPGEVTSLSNMGKSCLARPRKSSGLKSKGPALNKNADSTVKGNKAIEDESIGTEDSAIKGKKFSEREEQSSIAIQSLFRGRSARKHFNLLKPKDSALNKNADSTVKGNKVIKNGSVGTEDNTINKKEFSETEEQSSIVIQSLFRGRSARKHFNLLQPKDSASKKRDASIIKGNKAIEDESIGTEDNTINKKEFSETEEQSSIVIQSLFRGRSARKHFNLLKPKDSASKERDTSTVKGNKVIENGLIGTDTQGMSS